MRAVITAGPTIEAIDPIRFISNRSSGRQGYEIAKALRDAGFEVVLVAGPTALKDPQGMYVCHVESARDMLDAVLNAMPCEVFISVAAVCDWRPVELETQKIKVDKGAFKSLELEENPDILQTISNLESGRPKLVIGFAAETHNVLRYAEQKRIRKGCDWIVANDVSKAVIGTPQNEVVVILNTHQLAWKRASKATIAKRLVSLICMYLSENGKRIQ